MCVVSGRECGVSVERECLQSSTITPIIIMNKFLPSFLRVLVMKCFVGRRCFSADRKPYFLVTFAPHIITSCHGQHGGALAGQLDLPDLLCKSQS